MYRNLTKILTIYCYVNKEFRRQESCMCCLCCGTAIYYAERKQISADVSVSPYSVKAINLKWGKVAHCALRVAPFTTSQQMFYSRYGIHVKSLDFASRLPFVLSLLGGRRNLWIFYRFSGFLHVGIFSVTSRLGLVGREAITVIRY